MRKISKAAVAVAAAGIAVFGTMAAGGGVAHAATDQSATGCDLGSSLLTVNLIPTCTSPDTTVNNPTSITITTDKSFFTVLGNSALTSLLGGVLGETVTYTLDCSVDGSVVPYNGSFQASTTAASQSVTVDLQKVVGSPEPNSCTIKDLSATSLLGLNTLLYGSLKTLNLLPNFSFGVSATADTAVPGAVWMQTAANAEGANADICMDDANNGNNGAKVQVYQCNSDLAQYWVQTTDGQLVRNGDCLTQSGDDVVLATCNAGESDQQWSVSGTGGKFNQVTNGASGGCLTVPSVKNFTQLKVVGCDGGAAQKWTGPAKSAA